MQLVFVLLFCAMIPPALFSLLFASSSWWAVIWNGLWYMAFGDVAVRALGLEQAKYVGLAFFSLYLYRALTRPATAAVRFRFQGRPGRERDVTPERAEPSDAKVIEGEYQRLRT